MCTPINQIFPPAPTFVEKDIPDLAGKVVIVTGSTSGVGYETASILYSKNATVYIAARSSEKAEKAISLIKLLPECSNSQGHLAYLPLDLSDLSSIRSSVDQFLAQQNRLDVLIQNAGVMTPPAGSKTKLGHDLEIGTNCLGPFLFNTLLRPVLKRTAANAPADSVRVIWLSSMVVASVPPGGIILDKQSGQPQVLKSAMENYMQSKVGNLFFASEMARRHNEDRVIHLSVNPGLMKTELQRNSPAIQSMIMGVVFKAPRYGAYTELFAGFSPQVTSAQNGSFVIPWGRFGSIPSHIEKSLEPPNEGEPSVAERFWGWCDKETAPYQKGLAR
ncbi:NAD(P)-binding protein [Penicillium canariense]|uniref:NAD(P)-binding protein n=1 Tax=Penicillium canariense TaxID=189055 RepID=A0A9W9LNY8_9EURO|nr:NAD(P)-binding protein [Penicillium canariense]KAJ5168177.1 NAD(P)-binding protein [Penicillium canariense]